MEILVTRMQGKPVGQGPMEIVERKGAGHPDSLCDGAAEAFSIALCRHYLEHFGRILHYNVDKAVLVGGTAKPACGGGKILTPMKMIFVGRATERVGKHRVPVKDLALEAGRAWFAKQLPHLDVEKQLRLEVQIKPGAADLVANFDAQGGTASNDTSLGVGFAPMTQTETVVSRVEAHLNSAAVEKRHPEWGQDVKVMGTRVGRRLNLTVALAFVDRFVPDLDFYFASREQARAEILRVARKHSDLDLTVDVNRADIDETGSVYLTVTGTSAEMGDDGQVGRGNRPNGLITPYRPMTLEAAAGKNPTSHVGKIYNIAAWDIAKRLARKEGVEDVHVYLVSKIGAPVDEPQALEIRAATKLGKADLESAAREVAAKVLKGMPTLWKKLMKGGHQVW